MLSRRSARSRSARARSIRMSCHTPVSIGRRVTRRIGRSSATTVTIVSRAPSPVANLLAASNAPSLSETVPPRPSGGASLRSRRSPASRPTSRGGRSGRPYQAVRIKRVHPSPNPSHEQTRESGEDGSRGCAASAPPSRPTAAANTRSKKSSSLVACRSSCGSAVVRDWAVRAECAAGAPGIERVLAHRFRSGQCVERVGRRSSRRRHVRATSVEDPSWSSPPTPRSRSPTL